MRLFEEECWVVTPRVEENVFRDDPSSLVGYLIDATTPDGSSRPVVDQWGIGATEADRIAATLFCAAKDIFNTAEMLAPVLQRLRERGELNADQEEALDLMLRSIAQVEAATPTVHRSALS